MITEFATSAEIESYNREIGRPTLGDPNPFLPGTVFTQELFDQANTRANNHIRIKFFNNLRPEFLLNKDGSGNVATTVDELRDDVRAALMEAVSIAASLELENPNVFKAIYTPPSSGQEVKKTAAGTEFFQSRAGSTVVQLSDSRGQDADIQDLLDKYLLVPQHPQNQTDICPNEDGSSTGLGIYFGNC